MGVEVYYYTGDSGSSINRTFYNGEMVSEKVLAFPIVPSGLYASLGEMHELGHYDNEKVLTWLKSIPDYGRNNRTLRLFYSHPYGGINSFLYLAKKADKKINYEYYQNIADNIKNAIFNVLLNT